MTNPGLPSFDSLSFEDAVHLFKSWGFQVDPGPGPEEVTLILNASDHRTYSVCPVDALTQMAIVALRVRLVNGTLCQALTQLRRH